MENIDQSLNARWGLASTLPQSSLKGLALGLELYTGVGKDKCALKAQDKFCLCRDLSQCV